MQTILKYTIGGVLVYVGYCLVLFFVQRMVLFPRGWVGSPPDTPPLAAGRERIWLDLPGGKVETWYIPASCNPAGNPAPLVIFAHGNGELIDFWPDQLEGFNRLGLGLLLVEYPGYGRSGGRPTQRSITDAFLMAYDGVLKRSDVDPSRIILMGRSLGGGAVCALAELRPSAALIMMSAFTGVRAFALRYLMPPFLVRDPFDNLSVIRKYRHPVLIIHGQRDEIVPYSHGLRLHRAARKGRMITYAAGHNDCPPEWNRFWEDIEAFLHETGILRRTAP